MAIYLSAGHYDKDPGATANGYVERDLAIELRDLIVPKLSGYRIITDKDSESLSQYLKRISPGDASVVVEIHFNAATPKATGTEVLVADGHNKISWDLADDLSTEIASTLCIPNRGVKTESDSHRGRLAFVRQPGACALIEVCFITNPSDMDKYEQHKEELADRIADVLKRYDDMVA